MGVPGDCVEGRCRWLAAIATAGRLGGRTVVCSVGGTCCPRAHGWLAWPGARDDAQAVLDRAAARWQTAGQQLDASEEAAVFRYFPDSPMLSQGVLMALNVGGDINELDRACRAVEIREGVPTPDSWAAAWTDLVRGLSEQGAAEEARGHRVTAAHRYRRAAIYSMLLERYLEHTDPRKLAAYQEMQRLFWKFVELAREPVERVEVPFGDHPLPALFIPAAGAQRAPAVICVDGFDIYKELLQLRCRDQARVRGLSLLIVDTPGVGEALRLRHLPARPDTEVPVGACVDYLESRPDVDPQRIGLLGVSLGGYYAPRAAAFEKRLRCCAAWGAMYDAGRMFRQAYAGAAAARTAPASQLMWVTGTDSVEEGLRAMDRFSLEGIAEQITCPLLVLHGRADHLVPLEEAERLVRAARNAPRAELIIGTEALGGAGHCSMDSMESGLDLLFDWLADVLGAAPAAQELAYARS